MYWLIRTGIVVLIVMGSAQAECIDSLWLATPSTANSDLAGSVMVAQDGNIVVGGYGNFAGVDQAHGWLIKLNPANGNELWSHTYSSAIGTANIFLDVSRTSDHGFIAAGWSRMTGTNQQHYWLLRTNASGDSMWSRNFGNNTLPFQGRCVVQTQDGGYAIGGRAHSLPGGFGLQDWLIIKTNANGDSVWSVLIGDSLEDTMTDMILSRNGTIVVMGSSQQDTTREGRLAGISTNGQVMWNRTYSFATVISIEDAFELPVGEGYMVCGSLRDSDGDNDCFIMEVSDAGVRRWHRTIAVLPDDDDLSYAIRPDGLDGWYMMGHGELHGSSNLKAFALHLSSCGDTLGTRWLEAEPSYDQRLGDATVTPGGQIVMCGNTLDTLNQRDMLIYGLSIDTCNMPPCVFDWVTPDYDQLLETPEVNFSWTRSNDPEGAAITYLLHWESDYWYPTEEEQDVALSDTFYTAHVPWPVSPLDEIFTFQWQVWATDGQDTVEAASGENVFRMDIILASDEAILQPSTFHLTAYPNPFNPTTTLSYSLENTRHVTLDLFDVQGRHVRTLIDELQPAGSYSSTLDGNALSSGIYFAHLRTGQQTSIAKLVLLK